MSSEIGFCKINELIEKIEKIDTDQILLIADLNVWGLYSKILPLLELKGKKVILWKAPDGEKVKNMENLNSAVEFFLSKNIHRNSHMISFGGGATSDFAGMVASVLLRGISWSVIPTTLLSMVDAGIGGKVAVNSAYGKNLIGAFHHPENIWICSEFLETLPKHEYESGLGEIIKYGFLDKEIYDQIIDNKPLNEIVKLCVLYKKEVTTEDFKEQGRRMVLNFGHTLGHALERIYSLSHGVAVAWGLVLVTAFIQENKNVQNVQLLTNSLGLDLGESPWKNKTFPISEVMEFVKKDKKTISTTKINFVLSEKIGSPFIKEISFNHLENHLRENLDELRQFSL